MCWSGPDPFQSGAWPSCACAAMTSPRASWSRASRAALGPRRGRGAAPRRALRAERQQHHLRGVRRPAARTGACSPRPTAGAGSRPGATRAWWPRRRRASTEGQRVLGLVPMGTYLTVRPAQSPVGFTDAALHRAELSPSTTSTSPVEGEAGDAALIMRPLFGTAVLLDLVLAETGFDRAPTIVLTSASSKTALWPGAPAAPRPLETIGLTSATRRSWVESLGLYGAVLAYEELSDLSAPGGAVLVDFAGDRALVRGLHEQLGDALQRSILVGFTHRAARRRRGAAARPRTRVLLRARRDGPPRTRALAPLRRRMAGVRAGGRANDAHRARHRRRRARTRLPRRCSMGNSIRQRATS